MTSRPSSPASSSSSSSRASNRRACAVASSRGARSCAETREDLRQRAARGAGERGERRVAGAGERAQGADDRRVRQLALAQLDAVAADHAHAVRARRALELAEQARLADARLAGHERERGAAVDGLGERGAQFLELGGAADEARAGDPGRHDPQYRAAARRNAGSAFRRRRRGRGHAQHAGAGRARPASGEWSRLRPQRSLGVGEDPLRLRADGSALRNVALADRRGHRGPRPGLDVLAGHRRRRRRLLGRGAPARGRPRRDRRAPGRRRARRRDPRALQRPQARARVRRRRLHRARRRAVLLPRRRPAHPADRGERGRSRPSPTRRSACATRTCA